MIKKMYANPNDLDIIDISNLPIKISKEKSMLHKNKPVWVSDRDPFENLREVYKKYPYLCHSCKEDSCTCCLRIEDGTVAKYAKDLGIALKKDLKNFDEGE